MAIVPFRHSWIPYRFFHVNYYIIGINLVVFMSGMLSQLFPDAIPGVFDILSLTWPGLTMEHSWWQLFTWFFAEPYAPGRIFNLVFNMLALVFFGEKVEHEMGSIQYLLWYLAVGLVCGILAMPVFALFGMSIYPLFGVSALVLAILTLYAALYPDAIIHLMGIFPLRAPVLLVLVAGLEIVFILVGYRPIYLVNLIGLGLGWLFVVVRYRTNPLRHLFR